MTHDCTSPSLPRRGGFSPWLLGLLLAALAIRLTWVLCLPTDRDWLCKLPDQREYLDLAANLAAGNGLHFVDVRFADTARAFRMPGYPLLITACGGDVRAVRIVQAVIDTATVLAVYLLGRRWCADGASAIAAALVAFNPFLVYFCGLVLTETLFTAMLAWAMVMLVGGAAGELRSPARYALGRFSGAVLLVLSIYVRPSAIALPLLLGIVALIVNRDLPRRLRWRWSPPPATSLLLLTVIALLPWAWRNHLVLGRWIWTTTNAGVSLYDGLNPDATGASDQSFVRSMPQLKSMDEVGRSQYLAGLAWRWARENPGAALKLAAVKVARTWSPMPLSNDFGKPLYMTIALAYSLPLYVLVILGLWCGRAPLPAKVFLMIPAIYFTAAHALTVGSLRYRVPAEVPMAVVAALGAGTIRRMPKQDGSEL